jgi:hypothetical protein
MTQTTDGLNVDGYLVRLLITATCSSAPTRRFSSHLYYFGILLHTVSLDIRTLYFAHVLSLSGVSD